MAEDFFYSYSQSRKKASRKKFILNSLVFVGALVIFLSGAFILWISSFQMPNLDAFKDREIAQSTKIYDRTGQVLLYEVHQNIKRTVLPFDQISPFLKNATVAIEDSGFYSHGGIKITSIIRAVLADLVSLKLSQGGSTITQQVIKNSLLSSEKTVSRKIKEWVLAMRLEKIMNKDDILNIYLNETSYGGSIYGVEEAAQTFFGKTAADVSLAEAAYIAALPQAPTFYSPYGNNRAELDKRKNLVLSEMLQNGLIDQSQYDSATKEQVKFLPQEEGGIKAPHFVMYVKQLLVDKYGEKKVDEGGLKVITTLDYNLQAKGEELAKQYATENKTKFNAENLALVAIDPKTGQILSMVGSRDYFDKEIDGNFNVTVAHRQPGSSFKPLVYSEAFVKGYTPDTVLFDLPTEFSSQCSPQSQPLSPDAVCYTPQNYDGQYRGPMTLKNALAQSVNIPSVKIFYLAGLKDSLDLAKNMGIQSLGDPNQYGLTLVLGGGEVSLLDMTGAYSVFADDGIQNPHQSILKVEDSDGQTLEEFTPNPTEVLPSNVASEISSILSDNVARTPLYGPNSLLYFPDREVAVKTGTTNDYKDAWILGYTPSLAVGAWAGNNDNTPMEHKISGLIVSPFWRSFMDYALATSTPEEFKKPAPEDPSTLKPVLRGIWQGGQTYFTDSVSGKLATQYTPAETKQENTIKNVHSILYWLNKDDPRGAAPKDPTQDSQFANWEYPIRQWVVKNGIQEDTNFVMPTGYDNVHGPGSSPTVKIQTPADGLSYPSGKPLKVQLNYSGTYPLSRVDYFLNGQFVGSTASQPFTFSIDPKYFGNSQQNELRVVVYDSIFNKGESTVNFSLK